MAQTRPRYDRATALDAALDLFWRKGFHATSLKDIEAALAMKPGSIYAAFRSKEALFREVLRRYFEAERDRLRVLAARDRSPLEGLVVHLRRAGQEADRRRACMLVKTVLELSAEEGLAGVEARGYLDALQEEFRRLFRAAAERGELAAGDPDRLARLYQSKLIALKIEAQRGIDPSALQALAEDMAGEIASLAV
jgi:TetR/AcrR family transcriptional regulator, transcriptional repressor for nem operon